MQVCIRSARSLISSLLLRMRVILLSLISILDGAHMEPIALAMVASWSAWCCKQGKSIQVHNLGRHAGYAARMRLFQHLGVSFDLYLTEHEEAGRFLPLTQVAHQRDVGPVIGDISALLHLDDDPESLAAVQYCVSELLRNMLEHSGAESGAFVCAHRYIKKPRHNPEKKVAQPIPRVSIAVADCGQGISAHLGHNYPDALKSDAVALGLVQLGGNSSPVFEGGLLASNHYEVRTMVDGKRAKDLRQAVL